MTLLTLTTATSTLTLFDSVAVTKTVQADTLLFGRVESFLDLQRFKRFAFSNTVILTAVLTDSATAYQVSSSSLQRLIFELSFGPVFDEELLARHLFCMPLLDHA